MVLDSQTFTVEVYHVIRQIPLGKVATYKQIASLAGSPYHARLVGRIVSNAPASLHLPCHRIVNSQGRLVPSWPEQASLLAAEGVILKKNGHVDLSLFRWNLDNLI